VINIYEEILKRLGKDVNLIDAMSQLDIPKNQDYNNLMKNIRDVIIEHYPKRCLNISFGSIITSFGLHKKTTLQDMVDIVHIAESRDSGVRSTIKWREFL